MGSCIASWGDWLNSLCAGGKGEDGDEEGGETNEACCGILIDTFSQWVSPTEPGSFMRSLLCPVIESETYKKYAQSNKLQKAAMTVGFLGFLICMESFFAKPWWSQVQACIGEDSTCPQNWKMVVIIMYLKSLGLNIMGMLTGAGLVYGIHTEKPDYVTLWLMWRTIAVCMGFASFLLIFVFSHFSPNGLDAETWNEFLRMVANLFAWLIVFAYSEQDGSEKEDAEGGIGGDDAESGEADGFLPETAREALSSAIY